MGCQAQFLHTGFKLQPLYVHGNIISQQGRLSLYQGIYGQSHAAYVNSQRLSLPRMGERGTNFHFRTIPHREKGAIKHSYHKLPVFLVVHIYSVLSVCQQKGLPVSDWALRSVLSCNFTLETESLLFSELSSCCFSFVLASSALIPSCSWLVYFSCCTDRQKGSRMWNASRQQSVQM